MSRLEILTLTEKGEALSHSVSIPRSNDTRTAYGWRVIHFIARLGGRATFDRVCYFVFGNNQENARSVISYLKSKGYVTGE